VRKLTRKEKRKNDNTHAVWVKDYVRKRETFGCYNSLLNVRFSESQSDLVKLHAHRHRDVLGTF